MKIKHALIISCLIALNISACSRIKGYFPDKEKDYQLTSEIPEITIPEDLSSQTVQSLKNKRMTTPVSENNISYDQEKEGGPYINLIQYIEGTTQIHMKDNIRRSWRLVGKALSRHSIEITDRDEVEGTYYVQYDPGFTKIEDGSLWDEFLFIFGSDPAQEKKFAVKLIESKSHTEVFIHDHNDERVSEGTGLALLELIYTTIKDGKESNK